MWEIGHIAKTCQVADKQRTTVNKKPDNKRTRKKTQYLMVTKSTTESEPDDVPLLGIQSPRKLIAVLKYSWRFRVSNDNGTRHWGICLDHLKQSIQRELF